MKTTYTLLLAFLILLVSSCDKKEPEVTPVPALSGVIVDVRIQDKLTTGQIIEKNREAVIMLWKAENRDFEIKSTFDALDGYAYDKISKTSIKYDYVGITHHFVTNLDPGKYYLYVLLSNELPGRYAYSYTTIEVKKGEVPSFKKVFSQDVGFNSYEDWDKNK